MRNISKVLSIALFISVASAPFTVDAAWWNPFSWFRKSAIPTTRPVPTSPEHASPAPKPEIATTTLPKTDNSTSKPLPPVAKPPVPTMPVQTKPVVKPIPNTPATSTSQKPTTTVSEIKIQVPSYVLNPGFTPQGFVSPRTVKNGTLLLVIEVDPKLDSQAIGTWYADEITWRIVSEAYRSGDLTVSVSSGAKVFEDSSVINESHTTKLSSHAISQPISFTINGQTPRKGMVKIVIDEIKGHTTTKTDASYTLGGTPLSSPDFSISGN